MKYNGFDTLKEALDAHREWLTDSNKGKYADLSYADLRGADLYGVDLRGANLSGADLNCATLSGAKLHGANLPAGYKWEQYLAEVVPALCTAGGKTLEEVAAGWDCHEWDNCPMHIAFDAPNISAVPALYRREAEFFIQLFDADLIPNPVP